MAECIVLGPQPQPPPPEYKLILSKKEAQALIDILGSVGGCPINSSRRHSEAVYRALERAGIRPRDTTKDWLFENRGPFLFWRDGK